MKVDAKQIWAATYAAAYVEQVFERINRGHGPPGTEELKLRFGEEAAAIADDAVETYIQLVNNGEIK